MAAKRMKRPASIKLNLIPPYVAAARKTKFASVLTAILCLLVLGGMGLWWQTNSTEIARLEQELQKKTQEAQVVLDLENRANSKRQEVADITNALKVLDEIRKSGEEWTNITRKVAEWIPEEVKLTQLTYQGTPTNAQSVTLVGYTTSVRKLRDFYSQLSQSALFSQVTLQAVDKNGVPVPVVGLPPVLPKEKTQPEVTTELAPPGQQPSAAPGTPSGGPGMGMHSGQPSGGPGLGAHGPGSPMGGPPMGGPGMGMHSGQPSGGPGLGAHGPGSPMGGPPMGGPPMGGPPMGGPGMGAPPMGALGAGPMMGMGQMMSGIQQQLQIPVRDPVAPRNAVYFVILATLARPVQVAASLSPPQTVAGTPTPGAMMPGMMGPPMTEPEAEPEPTGPSPGTGASRARGAESPE